MSICAPQGGGQCGELLRAFDWAGTSLGAIDGWSPSLRTSVEIVLNSPIAMVLMWGPDHVMVYNDRYAAIDGARHPTALGQAIPASRPEAGGWDHAVLAAYLGGEVPAHVATRIGLQRAGTSTTAWFDVFYTPVRDKAVAQGILCSVLDDSKKRSHGALARAIDGSHCSATEERLRIAQEAGRIGSFEWFPASGKMVVSPTFRRIWGLSDEQEVTAELLVSLVDEQDRHTVGPAQLGRSDNPLAYAEYRIRRPDNDQVRWIARQGEVVSADGPSAARYVGVTFDITERKHTEHALRASQDRLAAVFGQAAVGLSEIDLNGRFRRVNGALCGMLGRSSEELLELSIEQIIHSDDLLDNRALFQRLVETGDAITVEKRYLKPDNSYVWVSSSMSRLVDERGQPTGVIAVKIDMTERRRAEAALRELNETLEQHVAQALAQRDEAEDTLRQAQKMDAVGQLTGGVAHDFNNVLQIVSGNLQLMLQHMARQGAQRRSGDAAALKRIDTSISAVERGAKLSSQLLAFARRQPLQPVVTDLGRLVDKIDSLLRRALGENIDIKTSISPQLWNTLIDPGQIENVILNLAINARHAMRGEGKLTIELGNTVLDGYAVRNLADLPAGQYVMLAVTDTGCGMSDLVAQRAFEPFFTTKPEGEGTGLGLSMAYGFVKQSHGHIKIDSAPGQGTSIKIYLPRSLQAESEELAAAHGPVVGGSETILVVEDDADLRATVVDTLSALGYHVVKAEDGQSALAILRSGVPVDVLFTDVVMPGPVRSPDLARQAKQILPEIAVLYTSGYPRDEIVHGGRLDPGVELLSKPYRREELARKLRHLLANHKQVQQSRQFMDGEHGAALSGVPTNKYNGKLNVLVVEDNPDAKEIVCELIAMLGHEVSGASDAEQAWKLMSEQNFDVLFTDVSLPGMNGIELAKKVLNQKPDTRIIFSTGMESIEKIGFEAKFLRKPYDLLRLKSVLMGEEEARG